MTGEPIVALGEQYTLANQVAEQTSQPDSDAVSSKQLTGGMQAALARAPEVLTFTLNGAADTVTYTPAKRLQRDGRLRFASVDCSTAPDGDDLVFDILLDGVSAFGEDDPGLVVADGSSSGETNRFAGDADEVLTQKGTLVSIAVTNVGSLVEGGDATIDVVFVSTLQRDDDSRSD